MAKMVKFDSKGTLHEGEKQIFPSMEITEDMASKAFDVVEDIQKFAHDKNFNSYQTTALISTVLAIYVKNFVDTFGIEPDNITDSIASVAKDLIKNIQNE
jgi:hypothetical protein